MLQDLNYDEPTLVQVMAWCHQAGIYYIWHHVAGSCLNSARPLAGTGLTTKLDIFYFSFYLRPVLAFGYCRCLRLSVCLSVCVCGNHLLVRAITHHPFKLGSPNLDYRCKRPWLRSLLFLGSDWPWSSRSNLTSKSKVTPFWACRQDHLFKLGSPNLGLRCKIPGLRFLWILGWIGLDLQVHFEFWNPFFYLFALFL